MTIPSKFHKQTLTRHHKKSFESITSIDGYKTREMNFEKRSIQPETFDELDFDTNLPYVFQNNVFSKQAEQNLYQITTYVWKNMTQSMIFFIVQTRIVVSVVA